MQGAMRKFTGQVLIVEQDMRYKMMNKSYFDIEDSPPLRK